MARLEDYLDGVRGGDPGTPTGARGFGARCPPCPACEPQRYYVQRTGEQTAPMRDSMQVHAQQHYERAAPIAPARPRFVAQPAYARAALGLPLPGVGPVLRPVAQVPGGKNLTPAALARVADIVAAQILPIYTPSDRTQVDAAMWTLDQRWLPSATFANMSICSRRTDISVPRTTQTWDDPYVVANGCRDLTGKPIAFTCTWGFWRLPTCDEATATTQAFQFSRYLWAQARMRELLENRPVPGVTSAATASAWTWLAAQYISVLLWATNIRWDNPQPTHALQYGADLQCHPDSAAVGGCGEPLLKTGVGRPARGAPVSRSPGSVVVASYQQLRSSEYGRITTSFGKPIDFDGADLGTPQVLTVNWPLQVRSFNVVGTDTFVPQTQEDFSPSFSPEWRAAIWDARGNPVSAGAPIFNNTTAIKATPNPDRAMLDSWFVVTWPQGKDWFAGSAAPQGLFRVTDLVNTLRYRLVVSTAKRIVDDMAAMLEHYSRPELDYISWMHQAVQTFGVESATAAAQTDPASVNFARARSDLISGMGAIGIAARRASDAAAHSPGTDTINTVVTIAASVVSLVLSLIGPIGTLINAVLQYGSLYVGQLVDILNDPGGGPCPAFPFIRVLSPPDGVCTITESDVEASLLGIDSSARWPVSIGGQTRTFVVDGRTFTATFSASDTTPELVARRISAAAVEAGFPGLVASVRAGQVHVQGLDPAAGPARATGGNAAALGFPGPVSQPAAPPPPLVSHPHQPPAASSGGGGLLPLAAGALLALKLLLG